MRNLFKNARAASALILAMLCMLAPALAAYPTSVPTLSDFTVSDTLTATCSSSIPTACAAHSVLGSVTNNTGAAVVTVSGTFTGLVLNSEGGDCKTTFTPVLLLPPGNSATAYSTTATAGQWRVHLQGFKCYQVRVTAITSGSVVVSIHFTAASASDPLDSYGNVKVSIQALPCLYGTVQSAKIDVSTAGLSQIIAGVAGQTIHVCSYWWFANGTGTVQWETGTGTACGTSTSALSGAAAVTPQTAISMPFSLQQYFNIPIGNALCINLGSSATAQGTVTYTQY